MLVPDYTLTNLSCLARIIKLIGKAIYSKLAFLDLLFGISRVEMSVNFSYTFFSYVDYFIYFLLKYIFIEIIGEVYLHKVYKIFYPNIRV